MILQNLLSQAADACDYDHETEIVTLVKTEELKTEIELLFSSFGRENVIKGIEDSWLYNRNFKNIIHDESIPLDQLLAYIKELAEVKS